MKLILYDKDELHYINIFDTIKLRVVKLFVLIFPLFYSIIFVKSLDFDYTDFEYTDFDSK